MNNLTSQLSSAIDDEMGLGHFLSVWNLVESILEAFSRATQLPIFVYLKDRQIFQSSLQTMPKFCHIMLAHPETKNKCIENGRRRANKQEPDLVKEVQLCHAGMINGRREIHTEIGVITILFGSRKSNINEAQKRKNELVKIISGKNPVLAEELIEADQSDTAADLLDNRFFAKEDISLIDAISDLVEKFLKSTVGFRVLTINMAHELTFTLSELGHITSLNMELVDEIRNGSTDKELLNEIYVLNSMLNSESRLSLYLVRNILSHSSESRYNEVVKPSFTQVNMGALVGEMIELYKWRAREKQIVFETVKLESLPTIYASEMELRRVLHNVLNNAIKYSYHTTESAQRIIRIKAQVPYDPGFKKSSFAIIVENYGIGLAKDEQLFALKPGFRGKQAISEVPIGAGIGLSEVEKIMRLHKGFIKIESKYLHTNVDNSPTYLTTVKLVFPFRK